MHMQSLAMILGTIGIIYCCYFFYIMIAGFIKKAKRIPYAKPSKRFAVVIPARNEANVISNLIQSLKEQKYPKDLFDIIVVPNNCKDDTERVAREAGSVIFTLKGEVHTKGEVLHEVFETLLTSKKQYDGFLVFDADNVVDAGFLQAANNAMCAGYQMGQGYRDSKNPDDNCVAGCTSVFFWFMNRLFNQARFTLGMSSHMNGTGILIGAEMVRKNGYNMTSLTEDQELTAQCALAGEKIAWMRDAITYDEQPTRFRDSLIQRRRWAAGTCQCMRKYGRKLYANFFRDSFCRDIALLFTGVIIQTISVIPALITVGLVIKEICINPLVGIRDGALLAVGALIGCVVFGALAVLIISLLENKLSKARLADMGFMWIYMLSWTVVNLIGYLTTPPKWKEIPHISQKCLSDCEKEQSNI